MILERESGLHLSRATLNGWMRLLEADGPRAVLADDFELVERDELAHALDTALFGADVVGSYLADHKWPFANLVYLNAGTTAVVLILLPLLPAVLMQSKDAALSKGKSDESPSSY